MTTNINYTTLVNVDDATSFDRVYWLVEERGLSLGMLQAELGLDRAKEYCAKRLEELAEKGKRAKASYERRYELENKMKFWTYQPEWVSNSWFEDNSYVQWCDYQYFRMQYKHVKEVLEQIVEELEAKVAFEEERHCGDFQTEEEVFLPKFNQIHWDGARANGEKLLSEIKYSMKIGAMDEDSHGMFVQKVKKAISRREICSREYHKCMAYLYKFYGFTDQMNIAIKKAMDLEKPVWSPKSDVVESNAYSMSIEDAIDLKRKAEYISETHGIGFEEAVASLLDEDSYDSTFFAGEAMEDSVEDCMWEMAALLS